MIDYQEIVENLDDDKIKALLDRLKVPYIDKGKFLVCKTCCHNDDADAASWKLYYYKNNHIFYCYTECNAMSIFKFLRNYYETRDIKYDWHTDIYDVILDCSKFRFTDGFEKKPYESLKDRYISHKITKSLPSYPPGVLDGFIKYYPIEWLNDSISRAAMDKYNIRFSISQNKIIIPHYDINNKLVGIRGRALNPQEVEIVGKYMPVQIEGKWYSHPLSLNLYGLNFNKENIRKFGICYIGEAEKFCLQMEGFDFPNCSCAVCGSQLNKFQMDLLFKYCRPQEVIICFDSEEKEKENKYFNKLYKLCSIYKNYCNMSFIYDKKHLLKLKESPTDRGQEVFEELLRSRVRVK